VTSKYTKLAKYLSETGLNGVTLSFDDVEKILGFPLPESAHKLRMWWANDKTHSQAKRGWMAANYLVDNVDFQNKTVTFVRAQPPFKEHKTASYHAKIAAANLAKRYGELLLNVKVGEKTFDFASPDGRVVGELVMIRDRSSPSSYIYNIAGHLWYLEKVQADEKFIIFYGDKSIPQKWLHRFRSLVKNVRFYFIGDGEFEEII